MFSTRAGCAGAAGHQNAAMQHALALQLAGPEPSAVMMATLQLQLCSGWQSCPPVSCKPAGASPLDHVPGRLQHGAQHAG